MMSRCAPPKSSTVDGERRPRLRSRPRSDSAAICRPATQPSVRLSSASTISGVDHEAHRLIEEGRRLLPGEAQVLQADLGHLRPHAQAGQRQAGSSRVARMRWSCGGRCSSKKAIAACTSGWVDDVEVVEHEHARLRQSRRGR